MSKVHIARRCILLLSLSPLLWAPWTRAADVQVKFTNLKAKYNELRVEPVLVNEGSRPIFLRTTDGVVDVRIRFLDKRTGAWQPWPALSLCGNVVAGVKTIPPGGGEPIPLFWGVQALYFDAEPPPRTEYKLAVSYSLEPPGADKEPQYYTAESTPFRLELPKRKKR